MSLHMTTLQNSGSADLLDLRRGREEFREEVLLLRLEVERRGRGRLVHQRHGVLGGNSIEKLWLEIWFEKWLNSVSLI